MRRNISVITFISFLCWCFSLEASTQYQMLEYQPGAKLAVGWDSIKNDISAGRATCLEADSYSETKTEQKNPRYRGRFRLVHSKSDIEDGFGLNASASYRGLIYKAEGSAKYAQSKTVNFENTNISGHVGVETRANSLHGSTDKALSFTTSDTQLDDAIMAARYNDIRVKQDYIDLLKSDPKEFFRQCGDGFVADIYYGGRLNVLAVLESHSEESKKKLESSLKGSGGAFDVSVDGFISSVESSENTQFSASYQAVGTDGKELKLSDISSMKNMVDTFQHEVFKNDAAIRIRVVSYASLIPNSGSYRFGVVQDAIDAARLYRDLNSVWDTLGQFRDGSLTSKSKWERAVSKQCLADKQDEILDFNKSVFKALETCSKQMVSSMSNPQSCDQKALRMNTRIKSGDANCPQTTQIIENKLSQFDYRLFYPLISDSKTLDICQKPSDASYKTMLNDLWLKPVLDAQCGEDPNQPQCYNKVRSELHNNIHLVDSGFTPKMPTGGYQRSCEKCVTEWKANGGSHVKCSCRKKKDGPYVETKWRDMNPQCPQKTALQNCRGILKYGAC